MSKPVSDGKHRRRIAAAVLPISVLAGSALVWQSSESAYADKAVTTSDSFTAGTPVDVSATREGQVVFGALSGLSPDDNLASLILPAGAGPYAASTATNGGSKCVEVTNAGSVAASIRMYATGNTGGLAPYMLFTVDVGANATNVNCASYTTSAVIYGGAATNTNQYLSGFPTTWAGASANEWANVPAGTSRWYRISWLLPLGTSIASGGQTNSVTFTWEAR